MTDASVLDVEGVGLHAPRVSASFRLTSERHLLDPLRNELAIEGATSWHKGDIDPATGQSRRTHGWCLALAEGPTYSADTALAELLLALAARRDEILQAIRALDLDAHMCLDVRVYAGRLPAMHCTPATIGAMASYGASLSVTFTTATPD